MNAIIFGMMVALAVTGHVVTIADSMDGGSYDVWTVIVACICTGIAAGMVYGGGV